MTHRPDNARQLESVLSALAEGTISDAQAEWLNRILLQDEDARRTYWQHMALNADLRQVVAQLPIDQYEEEHPTHASGEKLAGLRAMNAIARFEETVGVAMPKSGSVDEGGRSKGVAARLFSFQNIAAMLLIGVSVALVLAILFKPAPPPVPMATVATLLESRNATWEDDRGRLIFFRDGKELLPQSLNLADGLAKVKFHNGAVVLLDASEGATRLQLVSESQGFLQLGCITALVDTEEAKGFTIEVPGNRKVIDRGTEFGMTVDEAGQSEVHVLLGEVELVKQTESGDAETIRLSKGEAARTTVENTDVVEAITFDRSAFKHAMQESLTLSGDRADANSKSKARSFVAYQSLVGVKGTQDNFAGALGMDFVVTKPIRVTELGAFDSDGDGFKRRITVTLWSRHDAGTPSIPNDDFGARVLAQKIFTPDFDDKLVGTDRFEALVEPIILQRGAYTIAASGYGVGEPNGNSGNVNNDRFSPTVNSGLGAIKIVGLSRWGNDPAAFPTTPDAGPANRYSAGTFMFELMNEKP